MGKNKRLILDPKNKIVSNIKLSTLIERCHVKILTKNDIITGPLPKKKQKKRSKMT